MINDKSSVNKKSTNKSPENLSEDLRRCLRERALFHRQFYYRLSNDPETRSKIEKLSNQSSKLLSKQNHLQNNIQSNLDIIQSNDDHINNKNFCSSNNNINDSLLHKSDNQFVDNKKCINNKLLKKIETQKPLIIQSNINNTNTNNSLPTQLNENSSEHVFKTCFNSIPTSNNNITNTIIITKNNTLKNQNDVNNMSIKSDNNNQQQQQQQQQQIYMLPQQLPNTLINNINKNQNDVTETNPNTNKVLNNSDYSTNNNNNQNQLIVKDDDDDDITLIKEMKKNIKLSKDDLMLSSSSSINIKKGEKIHTTDTTTTFINSSSLSSSENKCCIPTKTTVVDNKKNCNCNSSILDYFSCVTDGDREACNNSDYSTILPATTTTINRHIDNNKNNIVNKNIEKFKREKELLSLSSTLVLESKQKNLSLLLPSQKVETNNNNNNNNILSSPSSSSSSDLLSSSSVLSSLSPSTLSFDKLSNFYPNSNGSSIGSSSGSSSYCCCMINKHINKFENAINSTDEYNNYSEQVDSSDGIQQVIPIKLFKNNTLNDENNIDDDNNNNNGLLIKKRKRDLYRKFLKDQQKLELKNKLLIRRKYEEENQYQEGEYQFPCVENLIKMYTKLLQDKKTTEGHNNIINPENKNIEENNEKLLLKKECEKDETKLNVNEEKSSSSNEFQHQGSPVSDEGCLLGLSPYSSDCEDTEILNDGSRQIKEKVARSSSSDSALGLDEEIANIQLTEQQQSLDSTSVQHKKGRRQTLTVTDIPLRTALLPVAEPTQLPDSPTLPTDTSSSVVNHLNTLITQTAIPSKVLLEERVVEIPEDRFGSLSSSRRESAQSCMSDYNSSEYGGVRFVRTPSVVVSDYSDDVMCGITLEEIEYFRAQRMRRRSSADTATTEKDDACSDVSGSSSCSNLYYCGSTISALDGTECYVNGIRRKIDRKISDCSICSTVSGDDDDNDNNNDFHKNDEFQDQLNMDLNSQQQQQHQQNLDKQLSRKKT